MFYAYEKTTKVLIIKDSLSDVETNKCEEFETIEDIPFHAYEYYDLPDSISTERVINRIREPFYPIKEKNPLTPPENELGILTEA